jgi:hypothetical protein
MLPKYILRGVLTGREERTEPPQSFLGPNSSPRRNPGMLSGLSRDSLFSQPPSWYLLYLSSSPQASIYHEQHPTGSRAEKQGLELAGNR